MGEEQQDKGVAPFRAGDTVRCIDNTSRPDWAKWYGDQAYCEDMLEVGKKYLVRDIAQRGGHIGLNVGVPTPWGEQFWNAGRFEKCLLRLPSLAPASVDTHPKDGDALAAPLVSGAAPAKQGDAQTPPEDSSHVQ